MKESGLDCSYDHQSVRKELIEPEDFEHSFIHIHENRESGQREAIFAFELTGVAHTRTQRETEEKAKESSETGKKIGRNCSLFESMLPYQKVDFVYTGGRDARGQEQFNWKIIGSSNGKTSEEAMSGIKQLRENVQVGLTTVRKNYHFTPVTNPEGLPGAEIRGEWTATIKPGGVAVPTAKLKQIGFNSQKIISEVKSGLVFVNLADTSEKNFNFFPTVVFECPAPVKLVLSINPITLTKEELKKIASALKWLCDTDLKQIMHHKGIDIGVDDDESLKKLKYNLELWMKSPSGYRINCKFISDRTIPMSFLSTVGKEVFHGCPISININHDTPETLKNEILDLSDCVNSAPALPWLFPSALSLAEIGVKRHYDCSGVKLASNGILLGQIQGGKDRGVRITKADRSRHCYIIGSTGTGKSTLLYNMIVQDIENGEGVTVIDPHGDLYQKVLRSIPASRIDDVVLVDPCDFEYSVGINFLECNGLYKHVQMNYIVNEMIKIFDRLYDLRETGGPMFEQYMRNAMLLVMDNDFHIATLMDIPMIFEDKEYRNFLISKCKNPFVESFWIRQAEKADGEASLRNMAPYITSKLNQFTANALLRPIIGQSRSTINFREVMDEGKILLVNLSKGLLGEMDTQLLGMLIIGKIFSAAMSRVSIPAEQRRPMFLYVDEFQNFATDTVAQLLSESRKFGLSLILANQNLSQLLNSKGSYSVIDAVLGNVGTMLIFRLGAVDAERMQIYTKPELETRDLQDLPDFHVAARLLNNNTPTRPFVFKPVQSPNISRNIDINTIVNTARKKYMRSTIEVEDEIIKRRTSYNVLKEIESDIVEELSGKI